MSSDLTIPYEYSVFINCPFDDDYVPIMHAIVFAVQDLGFVARMARERDDSSEGRLSKISDLVKCSKYGIHDLSRSDPSPTLPRFNMPLELGIFLGCKMFGGKKQRNKIALVLDRKPYRYLESTSDLRGTDIKHHNNNPKQAIQAVRAWLGTSPERTKKHGAEAIWKRYQLFKRKLPALCTESNIRPQELSFPELVMFMKEFIIALDEQAE